MTKHRTRRSALAAIVFTVIACAPAQRAPKPERGTSSPEADRTVAELRAKIAAERLTFEVGPTEPLEIALRDLAGTIAPSPEEFRANSRRVNTLAAELLRIDRTARDQFIRTHPGDFAGIVVEPTCPNRSTFDWRRDGTIPPIRNQGGCGSCWDFAAMGAFESSHAIRNGDVIDTSEQQIMECAAAGSCCGGFYAGVFDHLISTGVGQEPPYPYRQCSVCCNGNAPTPYRAAVWAYVDPSTTIPSVAKIKEAICEHGGVAVAVLATPLFQAYTSGVFNEHDTTHGINHAVVLIGWDDTERAWLMRNSWGTGWGDTAGFGAERGYMWIAYDSNNVGSYAAWVDARSKLYVLPPRFEEVIRRIPRPEPGPLRPRIR